MKREKTARKAENKRKTGKAEGRPEHEALRPRSCALERGTHAGINPPRYVS